MSLHGFGMKAGKSSLIWKTGMPGFLSMYSDTLTSTIWLLEFSPSKQIQLITPKEIEHYQYVELPCTPFLDLTFPVPQGWPLFWSKTT